MPMARLVNIVVTANIAALAVVAPVDIAEVPESPSPVLTSTPLLQYLEPVSIQMSLLITT